MKERFLAAVMKTPGAISFVSSIAGAGAYVHQPGIRTTE